MPDKAKKPYSRPESRPVGSNGSWLHDRAPGTAHTSSLPTNKLLISNLHYEITPKDLTSIFGTIGTLIREPLIRYDRSGRSSGAGIVSFETAEEATRAKKQYDGILAKGQPISIAYDNTPSRRPPKDALSLINRIQKPPLLDRLSKDDSHTKTAPSRDAKGGIGPIRDRARATRPVRKKPQTAEELDKELDAFMGDNTEAPASRAPAPVTMTGGDVEMM